MKRTLKSLVPALFIMSMTLVSCGRWGDCCNQGPCGSRCLQHHAVALLMDHLADNLADLALHLVDHVLLLANPIAADIHLDAHQRLRAKMPTALCTLRTKVPTTLLII